MNDLPIDTLSDVSLTGSESSNALSMDGDEKGKNPLPKMPAGKPVFTQDPTKPKRPRKRKKKRFNGDESLCTDPEMTKWWKRRYDLFHRFDEGIQMDKESWFSVTPEDIATRQAKVCACHVIVDGFAGAGGNSVQFAQTCAFVISVDNCMDRLNMLVNNAQVYGVKRRIDVICGDMEKLLLAFRHASPQSPSHPSYSASETESSKLREPSPIDIVFTSPPWGGQNYTRRILPPGSASWNTKRRKQWFQSAEEMVASGEVLEPLFSIEAEEGDVDGIGVLLPGVVSAARALTTKVVIYLPRNTSLGHVLKLGWPTETLKGVGVTLEDYWLRGRRLAIGAYLGGPFPLLETHSEDEVEANSE